MTRRLLRCAVAALVLLSLSASLATSWLWRRSYRTDQDRVSFRGAGARYALRSERGRVTLWGPPPLVMSSAWPAGEFTPRELAAAVRNDQIVWPDDTAAPRLYHQPFGPQGRPGTPAGLLAPARLENVREDRWAAFDDEEARRKRYAAAGPAPLLAALEDPDRFVAAHVLLARLSRTTPRYTTVVTAPSGRSQVFMAERGELGVMQSSDMEPQQAALFLAGAHSAIDVRSDGTAVQTVDGLRADLRPPEPAPWGGGAPVVAFRTAVIDPAQLPAIRDQWHRRLDVTVMSVPHWQVVAAFALPPLLWSGVRVRRAWVRRRRRRMGLCLNCGFDLRASEGRCGECGEVIGARA